MLGLVFGATIFDEGLPKPLDLTRQRTPVLAWKATAKSPSMLGLVPGAIPRPVLAWNATSVRRYPSMLGLVPGAIPRPVLRPTPSGPTIHNTPVFAWNATWVPPPASRVMLGLVCGAMPSPVL